jgi:glycosyltransferase involved in cell wall biosynthesis
LPLALASVPRGSPVLVLDAESFDGTVAAARAAGARVIVLPWQGFVAARRFALAQVRTPWTFMLDADETLDERLRASLLAAQPDEAEAGFEIARVTYLCGRPIRAGGWGGESLLRLFRTSRAHLEAQPAAGGKAALHERWRVEGAVRRLAGTLLHDSYPTFASYWEKFDRYTGIEAEALRANAFDAARAFLAAPLRFAWLFFVRGGVRDGMLGAFVAFGSALYPCVVTVKALCRE